MKENTYLSTDNNVNNVFIEFQHLRDLNKYINSNTKFFMSNISSKKTEILAFLKAYAVENAKLKRKYTNKANREGYVFDVMLPLDINLNNDVKKIKKYVRSLVKDVTEGNNLQYFTIVKEIGKARILRVIILDRVYYPGGKQIEYTRNSKVFTKDIVISTKVRLNPFGTKNSNSMEVFQRKLYQLKMLLLKTFDKTAVIVKKFFSKLTYKKIYHAKAINEYYYIDSTLDQRNTIAELKKRKITIINLLVEELNWKLFRGVQNAKYEAFIKKWTNILECYKKRKINEINVVEGEILEHIYTLKNKF